MTVENEIPANEFIANNQKIFLLDFYVYSRDQLIILVDGVILGSNSYIISNTNDNGTEVTLSSYVSGVVSITRNTTKERNVTYTQNILPSTLNTELDRVYRILQELDYKDNRIIDLLDLEVTARIEGDLELRAYIDSILTDNDAQILDSSVDVTGYLSNSIRTQLNKNTDTIHIKDFGALSDGTLHKLEEWVISGKYPNLAAIQVDYPFVTSLEESIDYVAIQAAIEYLALNRFKGNTILLSGCSLVNREIIIRSPLTLDGETRCSFHMAAFNRNRPAGTSIIGTGDDNSICRTVRTRRIYRGDVNDPEDSPLNAVINIQSHGVAIKNMTIQNDYDTALLAADLGVIDPKIEPTLVSGVGVAPNYYGAPAATRRTYFGSDWDIGIFVGCKYQKNIENVGVYCFKKYGFYQSSADYGYLLVGGKRVGCPPFKDWRGNELTHYTDSYATNRVIHSVGADGTNISKCTFLGSPTAIALHGPLPKSGLKTYGKDLKNRLGITFNRLPIHGEELVLGFYDVEIVGGVGIRGAYNTVVIRFVAESTGISGGVIEIDRRDSIPEIISQIVTRLTELSNDTTDEDTSVGNAGQFDFTTFFKGSDFGLNPNSLFLSSRYFTTSPRIRFLAGTVIVPNAFIDLEDGVLVSGEYTPITTADPAPYCWRTSEMSPAELSLYEPASGYSLGFVEDIRGNIGMSDVYISDSNIYSLKHRSFEVKQIDIQRRVYTDIGGSCIHIDGLAGNGARKIQKMVINNCRIDTKGCTQGIILGYSNLISINNCIPDGNGIGVGIYKELTINFYGWISRDVDNGSVYMSGLYRTPADIFSFKGKVMTLGFGNGLGNAGYLDGRLEARGFISDLSSRYGGNPYVRLTSGATGSSSISLLGVNGKGAMVRYYDQSKNMYINNLEGDVYLNAKSNDTIAHLFDGLKTIIYHPTYAEPQYFYDLGTSSKPFNKVYAKEFIVSTGEGLLGDFYAALGA